MPHEMAPERSGAFLVSAIAARAHAPVSDPAPHVPGRASGVRGR